MRILHTVQFYHPHRGGSEEVVRQLSERLVRRGHEVTVATAADPGRSFGKLKGVRVEEFDVRGNAAKGIEGDYRSYLDYLRRDRFDVMMNYAAQIWSTDLAVLVLDELKCAKVIVPCGYSGLMLGTFQGYFSEFWRHLAKYDAQVNLSPGYRDALYARLYELDNAVVIPNAASEDEFETPTTGFREAYGVTTPLLVLSVCNHYPAKGHDVLINSFLSLERDDATLAVIGNDVGAGGCLDSCRNMAEGHNVIIATEVPRDLVVAAYFEADLYAMASQVECFPLVILESMAAGTPWVSTKVGNVPELPGGAVCGPAGMRDEMRLLLDSPERRKQLGDAGRSGWEMHYTWEKVTDAYEAVYESVVDKRKGLLPPRRRIWGGD